MSPLIAYLLKMMLISGVFYAYYYAVLRDKRFHQWNRFYLLSAVALSILIPLFHIPVQAPAEDNQLLMKVLQLIGSGGDHAITIRPAAHPGFLASLTWKDMLTGGYAVIVFALLSVFAYRISYIRKLHHRSPRRRLESITLVETREGGAPFSFFHWIFWNQDVELGSTEGEHILRHELTHVKQRHSLDKAGIELACILFFPVIFFYLIRRELQIIHEYLADKQAVQDKDIAAYAEVLLSQAFQTSSYAFANSFFQHPLKRRIAMMTHFNNPRFTYIRKILFLPLALGLFGLLAFRAEARHPNLVLRVEQAAGLKSMPNDTIPVRTPLSITVMGSAPGAASADQTIPSGDPAAASAARDTTPVAFSGNVNDTSLNKVEIVVDGKPQTGGTLTLRSLDPNRIQSITVLKGQRATDEYGQSGANGVIIVNTKDGLFSLDTSGDYNKIFTKVEIEPAFPGGETAWNSYVRNNIMTHMSELKAAAQSGTCELQFIVHKDGRLSDIKALTMDGTALGKLCVTLLENSPDWLAAVENGHRVNAYRRQKITFQMPNN